MMTKQWGEGQWLRSDVTRTCVAWPRPVGCGLKRAGREEGVVPAGCPVSGARHKQGGRISEAKHAWRTRVGFDRMRPGKRGQEEEVGIQQPEPPLLQ